MKFVSRVDLTRLPVENRHFYTGLTGGSPTTLDVEITVNLAVDYTFRWVIMSGSLSVWQLITSTAATDTAAGFVRPLDYNGSSNTKVWIRVLGF